jgi:hypothetical protein
MTELLEDTECDEAEAEEKEQISRECQFSLIAFRE